MKFLSICSGIEAASVAWSPLGWQAIGFSEIEPFPSAVLAHHYPGVPNFGDMTQLPDMIRLGLIELPDLLCGGTPCQAFSVAGQRRSLEDERGNLSLVFCEIANAIDDERAAAGLESGIVFWENVPGVLSTKDNAFGCFLAELAGEGVPVEPPRGKWTNAGAVLGPKRAVAWRVLDAQYFGMAQRRRRVFVVASAREDFDPAAVLFEFDGLRRDTAPSREAREVAPTIPARSLGGGGLGTDFDLDGGVIQHCGRCKGFFAKYRCNAPDECDCPRCQGMCECYASASETYCIKGAAIGRKPEAGPQHGEVLQNICYTQNCVDQHAVAIVPPSTHTLRGEGFDASEDGTPLVPVAFAEVAPTVAVAIDTYNQVEQDVAHPIRAVAGMEGIPATYSAGTLRAGRIPEHQMVMQPVAVADVAGTMKACKDSGGWSNSADHAAAGYVVPVAFQPTQDPISSADVCHAIGANDQATAAVAMRESGQGYWMQDNIAGTLRAEGEGRPSRPSHVIRQQAMQVRRLTPVECERLQGFPDGYTAIPWRKKPASECPDGPRYKALGNSWAVPVVRWIGNRIEMHMTGLL